MLAMVVFRFMLRRAPAAASKSLHARSTVTISRGSSPRTIHVSKRRLPEVGHSEEAREDSLQPDQVMLQVDDKEEGGQGAPWWMEKRMARTGEMSWRKNEASLWMVAQSSL